MKNMYIHVSVVSHGSIMFDGVAKQQNITWRATLASSTKSAQGPHDLVSVWYIQST